MADVYNKDETFALCDSLGVVSVRERLKLGQFHVGQKLHAEAWLYLHESSVKDRAEAREEDVIAIARDANTIALAAAVSASDANDIARSAKKYALVAAIAAIVAAIAAIKWR